MAKRTAVKNDVTLSFQERQDRRQQLEAHIPKVKAEYQQASIEADSKLLAAKDAWHEANTFRKETLERNERRGIQELAAGQKDQLDILTLAAETADAEHQAANEVAENLDSELTLLKRELESLDCLFTVEQVVDFQVKLSEALAAVSTLDRAIADQEAIISNCEARVPPLTDQARVREDLLAEIAVGKATTDDLKRLDDSIENEWTTVEAARKEASQIATPARQTIAGLSRKRDEAQSEYERVKKQAKRVYSSFLKGEAEKNCKEYCAAAITLVRCLWTHSTLHGLDARYGMKAIPGTFGEGDLFIPTLPLDSCKPHVATNCHGQFKEATEFRYRSWEAALSSIEAERARINALGVDEPQP